MRSNTLAAAEGPGEVERGPELGGSVVREGHLLVSVALATMLAPLNSTMIAVALPDIAGEFGVGLGETAWLVVGYLICMAIVQPVGGTLGDALGRRRIMLGALAGFLAASAAAPAAPSFPALVAIRLGQALAGALAMPNAAALIREWVPDTRRGSAYGLVGSAAGIAAGFGPPLGGLIVGLGGWRAIFAANLPVVAPALALGWAILPRERRQQKVPGLDLPAAVFELFRMPAFAAAAGAVALGNLAMYTTLLTVPQFLVLVEHRPSEEVGGVLAALSVPMVVLGPLAGRLSDRWGRRLIAVAGAGVTVVALAPLLWLGPAWSPWLLAVPLALAGCGLALQGPAVQAAAIEAAPKRYAGSASGVFSTSRYLGSIVGSTALAVLLGSAAPPSGSGLLAVFILVEAAALGALASSLFLRPRERPTSTSEQP